MSAMQEVEIMADKLWKHVYVMVGCQIWYDSY